MPPLLVLIFVSISSFASAAELALAADPSVKDKTNSYSIRTQVESCTPDQLARCEISTFVVSKSRADDSLVWERRIYFQHYKLGAPIGATTIKVKSLKFIGEKALTVTNSRGDSFEIALDHGHLKRPKEAREYLK